MGEERSSLRVGDRIRILALPGQDIAGYYLHEETRALYERLVAERTILQIYEIDEEGSPWVHYRAENSTWYEYLAIGEDDIWERVAEDGL